MTKLVLLCLLLLTTTLGCAGYVPTSTSTGTGGTGGGTQAQLEPFAATSMGFDDTETVSAVIAISDVAGNAGCALATSIDATPPGDGHEIVVRILFTSAGSGTCAAGTYAVVDPDCSSNGLDGSFGNCAEYRKYAAGSLVGHATATSFVVTLSDDDVNNVCTFDVELGFGTSGTYSKTFAIVYTGPAPWCTPGP